MKTPTHSGHSKKHSHHAKKHSKHHVAKHRLNHITMTPGGPHHRPVHTVAKHPHHHKARKLSSGFSDCAAQAIAQSLRATGRTVSEADIATLYRYTADNPDSGATILATRPGRRLPGFIRSSRTSGSRKHSRTHTN